jgi:hypothetical protein
MDSFSIMQNSIKAARILLIVFLMAGIIFAAEGPSGDDPPLHEIDPEDFDPAGDAKRSKPAGDSGGGLGRGGGGSGDENLTSAMRDLCSSAQSLLALGAMLLIVAAAAVYALGQIVGAETRARASVWATAMLTGAVIGVIIYLIVPGLIATMMGGDLATAGDPCQGITES